jgi:hypothetical protein
VAERSTTAAELTARAGFDEVLRGGSRCGFLRDDIIFGAVISGDVAF